MIKRNTATERPMGLQPLARTSCLPMQPPMPVADQPPMGPPAPAQQPSREAAVKAAKANIIRRKSLAKQRAQQGD